MLYILLFTQKLICRLFFSLFIASLKWSSHKFATKDLFSNRERILYRTAFGSPCPAFMSTIDGVMALINVSWKILTHHSFLCIIVGLFIGLCESHNQNRLSVPQPILLNWLDRKIPEVYKKRKWHEGHWMAHLLTQ